MTQVRELIVDESTLQDLGRLLNESPGGDSYAWFDTATGEILHTTSLYGMDPDIDGSDHLDEQGPPPQGRRALPDWQESERQLVMTICADTSGRYLHIPVGSENGAPGVLSDFARTLSDPALQDEVFDTMRGRGAFRRVKDLLHRRGKIQLWYDYELAREIECGRGWLKSVGVVPLQPNGEPWEGPPEEEDHEDEDDEDEDDDDLHQ